MFKALDLTQSVIPGPAWSRAGLLAVQRMQSAALTRDEGEALAAVPVVDRVTRPNADLLREGERTDQLFIMRDGWACRYMTNRNGDRQIIALLLPGDLVNLDALNDGKPGYGVRLFGRAAVLAAPSARMRALAEQHSGIAAALTRLALIDAGTLARWVLCLGRLSARQRVVHLLCELEARIGGGGRPDGACFALPLTQEQIADVVGLTPVHVNRVLRVLKAEELVHIRSGSVTLSDLPQLRMLAEFDPAYLQLDPVDKANSARSPIAA